MTFATPALAALVAVMFLTGCSPSLHSGLSRREMTVRVRNYFTQGMSLTQVEHQLTQLGVENVNQRKSGPTRSYFHPTVVGGDIKVTLWSKGKIFRFSIGVPPSVYNPKYLVFRFEGDDQLDNAVYYPKFHDRFFGSTEFQTDPHVIDLRESEATP